LIHGQNNQISLKTIKILGLKSEASTLCWFEVVRFSNHEINAAPDTIQQSWDKQKFISQTYTLLIHGQNNQISLKTVKALKLLTSLQLTRHPLGSTIIAIYTTEFGNTTDSMIFIAS
jgi:hypothetical protein